MKIKSIKQRHSVVSGRMEIEIDVKDAERTQLKKAWKIIQEFETKLIKILSQKDSNPKESDWCEIEYYFNKDGVIAKIDHGMAG